jgi:hypothetical protein
VPWDLSLGIKRTGCEADHSPPTSAEIKKTWIYTSTAPFAFMAYLKKCRDNFTFTFGSIGHMNPTQHTT